MFDTGNIFAGVIFGIMLMHKAPHKRGPEYGITLCCRYYCSTKYAAINEKSNRSPEACQYQRLAVELGASCG